MLEDLDSKLDLIVEKVESSERRLSEQMVDRNHSATLQKHDGQIQKHEEEISVLKQSSHH